MVGAHSLLAPSYESGEYVTPVRNRLSPLFSGGRGAPLPMLTKIAAFATSKRGSARDQRKFLLSLAFEEMENGGKVQECLGNEAYCKQRAASATDGTALAAFAGAAALNTGRAGFAFNRCLFPRS
jgi:hypothetical protein